MDKVTDEALGEPRSTKSTVLETGAAATQNFAPIKQVCAHLNAFHVYASDRHRYVEANHYCTHLNEDIRQCLIYDSDATNARLIGVEYMVTPRVFETLPAEERRLWHSHVFEVKSGMLVMPTPQLVPLAAWEVAETSEMEQVIKLYGKTYHFWQVDRGDLVPLGAPQLMMSFTEEAQLPAKLLDDRDQRFGVDRRRKAEKRAHLREPQIADEVDNMWKDNAS